MEYEIFHRPSYAMLNMQLSAGENVSAEAGAMVSMSSGIEIETSMRGGLMGGLRRKFLGGESFFINTFSAAQNGEVNFAPSLPGDIYAVELNNEVIFAQSGSFIASTAGVEVDTSWGGAKTFFSGEGLLPPQDQRQRHSVPLELWRDPRDRLGGRTVLHRGHRPHGLVCRRRRLLGKARWRYEVHAL